MMRPFALTLAFSAAIALSGCATAYDADTEVAVVQSAAKPGPPSYPDQAPLYSDLDNPMRPDEFQGATILDVDRYRPTYRLAACEAPPLARADASGGLDTAIAQARAYSDEAKGVGLIVMRDGEVLHESYAEGVTASSLTASASKMKSVLALLFGIALEQGHIGSVDDPVGSYLSEWEGDPRGAITLRELLTMSSGLGQADFMQIIFAPDVAAAALETPLAGEPGTEFAYSNAVSKLLATALERRVTKAGYASLAQYLHAELWCPMGGGDAKLWVDASGKARGYAGLHATLQDWARVGELIRNGGAANGKQIVPADWVELMAEPSSTNPQYGFQVWLGGEYTPQRAYSAANPIKIPHGEAFLDEDIIYFDGFGGQRVYVIPSKGLTIARSGLVNLQFDDSVLPNTLSRAVD